MRGASELQLILPAAALVELQAAPAGLTTAARYRMVLLRQEARGRSRVLGSLDGIALSADGYLHCYLDAARLIQGDYELRLEPDSGVPSSTTAFAFALRAPITAAFH